MREAQLICGGTLFSLGLIHVLCPISCEMFLDAGPDGRLESSSFACAIGSRHNHHFLGEGPVEEAWHPDQALFPWSWLLFAVCDLTINPIWGWMLSALDLMTENSR